MSDRPQHYAWTATHLGMDHMHQIVLPAIEHDVVNAGLLDRVLVIFRRFVWAGMCLSAIVEARDDELAIAVQFDRAETEGES
jgi:hypothetical protein